MAFENLRLKAPNFARVNGYFYHITQEADSLVQKTDNGSNAFSYPLDSDITNQVEAIEYDGHFFWTLENPTGLNIIIKKWEIDGFICKLKRTYTLQGTTNQKYDATSFAVESFQTSFSGSASSTATTFFANDISRMEIGDRLFLGPSTFSSDLGQSEEVVVLTVNSGTKQVTVTSPLQNSYQPNDPISFAKNVWIFNKFRPADADPTNGSGQLYSFKIHDVITTIVARKAGNEFRGVTASSFIKDPVDNRGYLTYINQTNMLYMETDPLDADYLQNVKSAAQNNQETTSTVIPVYGLASEGNTLFRLQRKATIRVGSTETTYDWGTEYNYQIAPLNPLPKSISLTAVPAIIAADGTSTSTITALVRDQFNAPVASKTVTFTDNDTTGTDPGFVNPTTQNTNGSGQASTTYEAGTSPNLVTITATV